MSKRTIDVLTCDRCQNTQEIRNPEAYYNWGRIAAHEYNGPKWIGSQDGKTLKDLCPACMQSLMTWWFVVPGESAP